MKKHIIIGILGALALFFGNFAPVMANDPIQGDRIIEQGDSIIVNFGTGGRMVLYFKGDADWRASQDIDFNAIIKEMATYVDSAKTQPDGHLEVENDWGTVQIQASEATVTKPSTDALEISINDGINIEITHGGERKSRKVTNYTDLYFGLNNYLEDGSIPDGTAYDLRPTGSRYFELAFRRQTRIGGEKSPLYLNYAISFSWYNFMFQGDQMLIEQNNQPAFVSSVDMPLNKSKLTVSYINFPLMLKFKKKGFSFAAGGYVGYRLGAHTKLKYLDERGNWEREKESSDFSLENVRYGLRAELNWMGPTLFAAYDMNTLFSENSGMPKLNAFTFGVKL